MNVTYVCKYVMYVMYVRVSVMYVMYICTVRYGMVWYGMYVYSVCIC